MIENKVKWCLNKAERELTENRTHRGLVKIKQDLEKSRAHIKKADHYLKATFHLKRGNFTDLTASTLFYTMYHSLLAIIAKFGYESRNQECTFALIFQLIEDGNLNFDKKLLDKITDLELQEKHTEHSEKTSIEIREEYQYGTEIELKEDVYNELLELTKNILSQAKLIIEQ
ncbi:hypothetical protein HY636_02610 [Candidatus Woesearchaeota archaeon]|nr:hypothetical protein [Candidatus Woesearchaeota archaeon]